MTIVIAFHMSHFREFKAFYAHLRKHGRQDFPNLVSYSRFVELMPRLTLPLCYYLKSRYAQSSGLAFIDSTHLAICDNRRIRRNRVFAGVARRGRTTMGWFFGFKLHLVIDTQGALLGVQLTQGNVDDRKPVPELTQHLQGKLYADKGYISKPLVAELFERGLHLVTTVRSNMKPKLHALWDKLMLRKRSLIETVNDQLKNVCQIDHTRHRSPKNFVVNLLSGILAYTHQPKRPSIKWAPDELHAIQQLQSPVILIP